ncbi:MAG: AMP-binding protein, partial [bacterium]
LVVGTITRVVYRIRVTGLENVPVNGPAMLLPNHVTLVDSILLAFTLKRRIRFVMFRDIYERSRLLKPILKLMQVIPISGNDSPRQLVAALNIARKALDDGQLVCIFPEGQLTRTGNLSPFKAGFQHVLRRSSYPIIPVYIGGAWGSIFSYAHGKPMTAIPQRLPYPVDIIYGRPMPSDSAPHVVRLAISELASEWYQMKKHKCLSMGELFARSARRNWFRPALSDTTGKDLTFGRTLIAATALANALEPLLRGQQRIGLVFPASVGGALSNYAVTILGKVTVNLNFTAGPDAINSAVSQCGINTVITSKRFIEHMQTFKVPCKMIFLEDVLPGITARAKFIALLKALFWPARRFAGTSTFKPDNILTILFSSGATAEPKGILLSHYNIISNTESFGTILRFTHADSMCAALPFFHSFGFTCTLWFPIIAGFRVVHHSNPLEGDKIAQLIRENKSTVLLATPTFLLTYIRRTRAEEFASLRTVITGAEKLRQHTAESFKAKFNLIPLEGYGVTELSPAVSVNVQDIDIGGVYQCGTKSGTIGQAIPGVSVKVVGFDGTTPLPPDREGLLLVKGPNVMQGYLNRPDMTAEVIRNGWYETGDIAKIDDDGFITITDRASRFSKLGGEMVPHIAIEETYLKALNVDERVIVVTSVPDVVRGERLIVLYTEAAGTVESLNEIITKTKLPNLWRPRLEDYIKVPTMPVLGSGKLDLKSVRHIAVAAKNPER